MSYLSNFCFELKAKDVNVKSMKRIYIVEFLILLNFIVIFHSVNATPKDTWSSESISSAPKI